MTVYCHFYMYMVEFKSSKHLKMWQIYAPVRELTIDYMMTLSNGNIFRVITQRTVTRSFYVFFDLRTNKRLSKQLWGWWFETLSRPLWRHNNDDKWPVNCSYLRHVNKVEAQVQNHILIESRTNKHARITKRNEGARDEYIDYLLM